MFGASVTISRKSVDRRASRSVCSTQARVVTMTLSSGAGAALAAGYGPLALGTDTNGANVNLTAGALVAPANGLAPTVSSTAGLASDQTLYSSGISHLDR